LNSRGKINIAQPIREQALEAFQLRNQVRTDARELMSNRELAAQLDITDPNLTLQQIVQRKYQVKGLVGDDLWSDILKSSTMSRPSVDKSLGLSRKK
jgi:hypothetical protein